MVVAQLVERLLPTPEVRSSNQVIGNKLYLMFFTANCIEKTKIKRKRPGLAHFFYKKILFFNWCLPGGLHFSRLLRAHGVRSRPVPPHEEKDAKVHHRENQVPILFVIFLLG